MIRIVVLLILLFASVAHAADTSVDGDARSDQDSISGPKGPYYSDPDKAVIVWVDADYDIAWRRTTNGGSSWGSQNVVESGEVYQIAAWFDGETPGDTGTLLHVVWADRQGTDAYNYMNIDIDTGSASSPVEIATQTLASSPNGNRVAITKTVSGNLIACFEGDNDYRCDKSTNGGTSWSSIADAFESGSQDDYLLLFPAATADDDDAAGIFWDYSANAISIKMYDDSSNSWSETSIVGSLDNDPDHFNFDAAVRHSDGHILLALHNDYDASGNDLVTYDLTPDSIASPTVTGKTNILTNEQEAVQVGVIVNQQNDDVYVATFQNGSWQSSSDLVFYKSDDDMATWGTETAYSETADDNRILSGTRSIDSSGGRIQWSWYNDDDTEIYVNLVNDIEISAGGGTPTPTPSPTPVPSRRMFFIQ